MDGWESQRKREEGHDFAIVRLGAPGPRSRRAGRHHALQGQRASADRARRASRRRTPSTPAQLLESDGWFPLIAKSDVKPDFPNVFALKEASQRVTHVRLRIYPGRRRGAAAHLRRRARPDDRTFWRAGSVDLGAVENGGTIAAVSDEFFGPPPNMLLPGRGVNMGDGWETKRRRTPGSDWAVVKLARRGVLRADRARHALLQGQRAAGRAASRRWTQPSIGPTSSCEQLARAPTGWKRAGGRRRRWCSTAGISSSPSRPMPVTHVRVHIFPHGGVNRLRLFGYALDTTAEAAALRAAQRAGRAGGANAVASFNGSTAWVDAMIARRPFASRAGALRGGGRGLVVARREATGSRRSRRTRASARRRRRRPRPRSPRSGARASRRAWRARTPRVLKRLAQLNDEYFKKFGFIYIVFATGQDGAADAGAARGAREAQPKTEEIETAARGAGEDHPAAAGEVAARAGGVVTHGHQHAHPRHHARAARARASR